MGVAVRTVPLADITPRQLQEADAHRTRWLWSVAHRHEALHTVKHRFDILAESAPTIMHQHRSGGACNTDCFVVFPGLEPLPCERCTVSHQPTQTCTIEALQAAGVTLPEGVA